MRVVMTGGGGFIGSYVLARMVGAGIDVTLLGPNTGKSRYAAALVEAGDVRFVRCAETFYEEDLLRGALTGADTLLLLGYLMPSSTGAQRLVDEFARNVDPLIRLVRAAEGHARHVVFASSATVYGPLLHTPLRECDTPRPATPYGVAKLASEHAIRILCQASGQTAAVLRYSTVYGPGETVPRAIPNFIRAALTGAPPVVRGDGLDEHDYVHVADVADATLAAVQRATNGVYNVATGTATTTLDLARLVYTLAGATAAPVFDSSTEPARSRTRVVCDTELSRAQLGFSARRSLSDGISEEIGWFRCRPDLAAPPALAPIRLRPRADAVVIAAPAVAVSSPTAMP